MAQNYCPSCKTALTSKYRFCPNCGHDLEKPIICPNCEYRCESLAKFCQECGASLIKKNGEKETVKNKSQEAQSNKIEIDPPSMNGITIEFPYSTSQTFDLAIESSKMFTTFKQFGEYKKAIYRVTFQPDEMDTAIDLIEYLKGWRRRIVYVDGQKVPWETISSFLWCYRKQKASYRPEFYCFGYDQEYELNIWGCMQAHMPFTTYSRWFCWGTWLNNQGDWKFDKERIRHELQKTLYPYRFCPAMQHGIIEDAINALPDVVNPKNDINWKFIEKWGDDISSFSTIAISRPGYQGRVAVIGVCPNGKGALKELVKKMNSSRIPHIE
jgi:double zinc ribbon protein